MLAPHVGYQSLDTLCGEAIWICRVAKDYNQVLQVVSFEDPVKLMGNHLNSIHIAIVIIDEARLQDLLLKLTLHLDQSFLLFIFKLLTFQHLFIELNLVTFADLLQCLLLFRLLFLESAHMGLYKLLRDDRGVAWEHEFLQILRER